MCDTTESVIIGKRKIRIDKCISTLIKELNKHGVKTTASCCGHGDKEKFYILVNKKSFVSAETPFYKSKNDISLIHSKRILVPKGFKCIDGVCVVNKGAKVYKDGKLYE